jgi:hypothetical protein
MIQVKYKDLRNDSIRSPKTATPCESNSAVDGEGVDLRKLNVLTRALEKVTSEELSAAKTDAPMIKKRSRHPLACHLIFSHTQKLSVVLNTDQNREHVGL